MHYMTLNRPADVIQAPKNRTVSPCLQYSCSALHDGIVDHFIPRFAPFAKNPK